MIADRLEQGSGVGTRGEYPRPRLVRKDWQSLNGPWEFAFDHEDIGLTESWFSQQALGAEIIVPFAYQTKLSGIHETAVYEVVWYARNFTLDRDWAEKSVLIHFGAVDYEASVWVNGVHIGEHRGGYTPFSIDISGLLNPGENRVCVRVEDRQDTGQPRGKQSSSGLPHGIDYWCTTGIWQSVWLEPVSSSYLADLVVVSDLDRSMFSITPLIHGGRSDLEMTVELFDGEKLVGQTRGISAPVEILVSNVKSWSPGSPFLYDIRVRLLRKGEIVDEVLSYAGMRSIEVRDGSLLLNGEKIYLKMVLDQGYWPDSGITAPSDDALKEDVEWVLKLGYNAVRKHQKVEDPRWLYWCDRLGLLVWGEMANARSWSFETQVRLEAEWSRAVERDCSHPCIIAWVPVNESMGFPDLEAGDVRTRNGLESLVHLTRRLDPTRPVIDNDGWEQTSVSDIVAIHDYSHAGANLAARYTEGLPERIWSGSRRSLLVGVEVAGRPIMLTEVGGFLTLPSQSEDGLDVMYSIYGSIKDGNELLEKYRELMEGIASVPFLSGFCYTQLTDVEQEQNGLLTYHRVPKVNVSEVAKIHSTMG